MKNMGLSDLRLVNPCPIDHPEALKFAVSARELLTDARLFADLPTALADCVNTVGTTRRHGKYRQEIAEPDVIAAWIVPELAANRAALVFGREDSGLTTDELALCRWHATIPTGSDYGSLNLAQAVLVFSYELFLAGRSAAPGETRPTAATAELENLYGQMEQTLLRIGFLNQENPAHIMRSIRRIFARAALDNREVAILRGLMTQVDWATTAFEGKKGR